MDITCIKLTPYKHGDNIFINSQIVIPIPEAEDYMARRREKKQEQESNVKGRAIRVLLDEGIVTKGDEVIFKKSKVPETSEREWSPKKSFWLGEITGKRGRSDNVRWLLNGKEYSFSGLTKVILNKCEGKMADEPRPVNGYKFWYLKEGGGKRSLSEVRNDIDKN